MQQMTSCWNTKANKIFFTQLCITTYGATFMLMVCTFIIHGMCFHSILNVCLDS